MSGPTKRGVKRKLLRERDGDECWICRTPMRFKGGGDPSFATLDHIVPRSAGGSHGLDNLRLACWACNNRRGNRPITEKGRFEFLAPL